MDIPGLDKVPPRYHEEVKRIKAFFMDTNEPSFKFERIIGMGARGYAVEIRIKDETDSSQTTSGPSTFGATIFEPPVPRQPLSFGSFFDNQPLIGSSTSSGQKVPSHPTLIGSSSTGLPLRGLVPQFSTLNISGKRVERFVMKRAFAEKDDGTIYKEIEFLRRLKGARNIQQLYQLPDKTEELRLQYIPDPTLFTEWIPNGKVEDLVMARLDWAHPLPNRMLWRCFLCMCHMLIAMAWPPGGNKDAPSAKPELPPENPDGARPQKSTMRHNDINIGNIMFGDFDTTSHRLVPILKLIDFGLASNSTESFEYTEESAVRHNMFRIAGVMVNLIGGSVIMSPAGRKDMEITINGERKTINSHARDLDGLNRTYKVDNATVRKHEEWLGNLDEDLKNLLVRCLASTEEMRPSLEELYQEVQRNATEKTRESYAGKRWQNNESDESVSRISRNLIVNRGIS